MKKTKLGLFGAALLSVLGMGPGVVASAAPAPAAEAPAPLQKTDGRRERGIYVPPGVRKRERSRVSAVTEKLTARFPNRFARRAVAKAMLAGRFPTGSEKRMYQVRPGQAQPTRTTSRAAEKATKLRWLRDKMQPRAVAARILDGAVIE